LHTKQQTQQNNKYIIHENKKPYKEKEKLTRNETKKECNTTKQTNKNCYHATKTKLTRKKGNKANINNNKRKCNI